jgi:hypothetical protein
MAASLVFVSAAFGGVARAQPGGSTAHEIPQSLAVEHAETLDRLADLSKHPGEVGRVATQALDLFREHQAREAEYILPALTLLPVLADGKVTPDMAWAVAMAERIKADRELIFQEHTKITDIANRLVEAGRRAHDDEAIEFAKAAVADSLNDIEIEEPAALVVGDYVRSHLPPSR